MLQGDTVRLQCHFKTFDGVSVNPTDVKLTIYKSDHTQIEQIPLDDSNRLGLGVFYMDYTPATELSEFIFEFSGSVNSKPILSRGRVEVKFNQ